MTGLMEGQLLATLERGVTSGPIAPIGPLIAVSVLLVAFEAVFGDESAVALIALVLPQLPVP